MRRGLQLFPGAVVVAASLGLAGCGSSGGGGTGTLEVEATDAPFAHDVVKEANLSVTRILAHRSGSAESGFVVIYDDADNPLPFNLVDLKNGVTEKLAEADVPAGTYRQLRLVVNEASLVLDDPADADGEGDDTKTYSSEDGKPYELSLTSAGTSGFKIRLDPPVEVVDGFSTLLILDVLLTKTFHAIPSSVADPLDATRFQLQPTIRAMTYTGGGIEGTVTDGGGAVENATVWIFRTEDMVANPVDGSVTPFRETATEEDGSYAVLWLPGGDYDVYVTENGRSARRDGETVTPGEVLMVDVGL